MAYDSVVFEIWFFWDEGAREFGYRFIKQYMSKTGVVINLHQTVSYIMAWGFIEYSYHTGQMLSKYSS